MAIWTESSAMVNARIAAVIEVDICKVVRSFRKDDCVVVVPFGLMVDGARGAGNQCCGTRFEFHFVVVIVVVTNVLTSTIIVTLLSSFARKKLV
jgi:hypothetical protein